MTGSLRSSEYDRCGGRPMLRRPARIAVLVVGVLVSGHVLDISSPFWCRSAPTAHTKSANGRTMFLIGGCSSCHATPKQDDATRLGGGLALPTAFGTFYVPNISSDAKDGIGGWNETQFIAAMRYGISPSGQHLYPAFPYTSYQRDAHGRPARSFRLSQNLAGGFRRRARPRSEISVQHPAHRWFVEAAVSRR